MTTSISPSEAADRTKNLLRPQHFTEIVGQDRAKKLMERAVASSFARQTPLDHTLLVAASGTGKTTFSHVVANELGVDVYELEAPVSFDTLMQLRTTMYPGDILKIEEIHQQGIMERRGRDSATQPEVLYSIMEDRVVATEHGVKPFPAITIIGTTTDEGRLPDAFINRFPLRPRLDPYSQAELERIAHTNARALELSLEPAAGRVFASASRGVPRQINNYMRNAVIFAPDGYVTEAVAAEVLDANDVTADGLTADMQAMLRFLYEHGRRNTRDGVAYQASLGTIATAIGKGRDAKAISLRVEPYMIVQGYVQVGHSGRSLTPAGVQRARELLA